MTPGKSPVLWPPPLRVLSTGLIHVSSVPSTPFIPTHLFQVEPHVVTEDVEGGLGASPLRVVAFDPRGLEKPWVSKLVAGGEGEAQPMSIPIAMKQAQHRAAPRFMCLQEHQPLPGRAGRNSWSWGWGPWLSELQPR